MLLVLVALASGGGGVEVRRGGVGSGGYVGVGSVGGGVGGGLCCWR